ncbi:hypothetical protein F5883DRAFT_548576 [Diaporthe sp. PMI_573]|nr:hypothetical protein F5883DRAFT_548576 [Diaporthaceae sp. PMI_573]
MIADNLTTWAESESMMRSDCHGWSATPVWEIGTEILGVKVRSQEYVDRVLSQGIVTRQDEQGQVATQILPRKNLVRGEICAKILVGDGEDGLVGLELHESPDEA